MRRILLRAINLLPALAATIVLHLAVGSACAAPALLVGRWAFDEGQGTAAHDSSGFGNTGSILSATWIASGISGAALAFDGSGAYVQIPHAAQYNNTDAVSVEAWIRMSPTQAYAQPDVFDKSHRSIDAPPYYSGYALQGAYGGSQAMAFVAGNGSNFPEVGSLTPLNDDRWHFIVGTVSTGSGRIRFYLDGEMTQEVPFVGPLVANAGDLFIGRLWLPVGRFFHGAIDEVALYHGELTTEEVRLHHERLRAALVGYWSFDEGAGAVAHDSTSYSNSGVIVGATWIPNGARGSALAFDGSTSYVQIPAAAQYDALDAVSVEAWIRMSPEQGSAQPNVLDKSHRGIDAPPYYSGYTFQAAIDGSYVVDLEVGNGSFFSEVGSLAPLNDDRWHFIAGTASMESGRVRFYLDGEMTQEMPFAGPIATNPGDLFVGRTWLPLDRWFHGLIDEVRLYRGALTAEEVRQHYVARVVSVPPAGTGPRLPGTVTVSPNPSRGRVEFSGSGARAGGRPEHIDIFDTAGRRVRRLAVAARGDFAWGGSWDGRDERGARVPSGLYLFRTSLDEAGRPTRFTVLR